MTTSKFSATRNFREDDTDQQKAIPFILIASSKGLVDVIINYRLIHNKKAIRLINALKLLILNTLMLYFGYKVMNNYIKRYAEDISYEQVNIIRIQQIFLFAWLAYFVIKGLKTLFSVPVPSKISDSSHSKA